MFVRDILTEAAHREVTEYTPQPDDMVKDLFKTFGYTGFVVTPETAQCPKGRQLAKESDGKLIFERTIEDLVAMPFTPDRTLEFLGKDMVPYLAEFCQRYGDNFFKTVDVHSFLHQKLPDDSFTSTQPLLERMLRRGMLIRARVEGNRSLYRLSPAMRKHYGIKQTQTA